jgi:hypothetical protein
MKKLVITTTVLIIAIACITVVYFKNLNPAGSHTSRVMNTIPDDAAVIFEFNNEQGFYDIFSDNTLLNNAIGQEKLNDIDTLRSTLLGNQLLKKYFDGQNLYISLHPVKNGVDLLLTISAAKGFDISVIDQLAKQQNNGLIIKPIRINSKEGYNVYISSIKKQFFIINKEDNIFAGSFSEDLARHSAQYKPKSDKKDFLLLSEQQNSNSLANFYVNNEALSPLFEQLFINKNTDILRSFRLLPALTVLSLNYKNDAFMFNGITTIQYNEPLSYLSLFAEQQPVVNHLKDIFPSTTAYSTNFSVSDPLKFGKNLSEWHNKAGIKTEKDSIFTKIKAETGLDLKTEFNNLLGNEFAIITTRYLEKYAIVSVKDGSKILPLMMNISTMSDNNIGQFNYNKLPFFLLGDAFIILKRPYFIVLDNYLILANSAEELKSYNDSYINRKFLNKTSQYNQFDDLVAERSNVAFFINFKNAEPVFKRDMDPVFYNEFEKDKPGWKNFYGASYQFSATDKNFYTNFCMQLSSIDTAAIAK